jgi:hypothetical protein
VVPRIIKYHLRMLINTKLPIKKDDVKYIPFPEANHGRESSETYRQKGRFFGNSGGNIRTYHVTRYFLGA